MTRTKEQDTLGERLRKRREAIGLSANQIARDIQAPARFLQGLEEDNYEIFPAKVYAKGFLRKFLEVISFPETDNFLKEFDAEWEVRMFRNRRGVSSLPAVNSPSIYLTPRRLGMALGSVALSLILLMLGIQLVRFVSSPAIKLDRPEDRAVLEEPLAQIKGKTEKESQLTVNGREIKIDGSGYFDEIIEVGAGLNELEFLVKDRFGKETKMTRYIIVK